MSGYPHFLYYRRGLKAFLPTFTTFHQLLLTSTTYYQLLYYFYQLLSLFTTFHQSLPTFYKLLPTFIETFILLFVNQKWFFSFFHLLTFTNPTILLDAMLQALIFCLSPFYMTCIAYIYFTTP